MQARLKYPDLAPEGLGYMRALEHYVSTGSQLEPNLLGFVRLLASLLNGCEYCIGLHAAELRKMNETPDRIAQVENWRSSDVYTHRERAALEWTESVTNIQDGHAPDPIYNEVREHFTDAEIVHLTLAITTINAWNRLAIALGAYPGHVERTDRP